MKRWWANWIKYWNRAEKIQDEIDEEISFHVQQKADKLEEAGYPPIQARQEAVKKFGSIEEFRASCQAIRGLGCCEWMMHDSLMIKTEQDPKAVAGIVRGAVAELDRLQPIEELTTLEDIYKDQLQPPRIFFGILTSFALVALAMAVAGIFGLLSNTVEQRRHEFGIRLSLGATHSNILFLVYRQGLSNVLGGIALGAVGTWMLNRYFSSVIFGVSPYDTYTLICVSLILLGAAIFACWRPAWQAAQVDPAESLRHE